MHTRHSVCLFVLLLMAMSGLPAWASHAIIVTAPARSEEALDWCGPATAQMIMEAYPSASCPKLQEDIVAAIQAGKVETMWDTDPGGLKAGMTALCPPLHGWQIVVPGTDPHSVMFTIARWMTLYKYATAAVLNTAPHNAYVAHAEHWIAITGLITDLDPTSGVSSVNLEWVWFTDPSPVNLGDPAIQSFVSGSTWYSLFQGVTKVGSMYAAQYVAVGEPQQVVGVAVAPPERITGRLILPEDALRAARKSTAELHFAEHPAYRVLERAKPRPPVLVNPAGGAYYLIYYALNEREVDAVVRVNAYDGKLQEVGVFKPTAPLSRDAAVGLARKHLAVGASVRAEVEAVVTDQSTVGRYFPTWRVTLGNKAVDVSGPARVRVNPATTLPPK